MKNKLYVILYYLAFLLSVGVIWYSSTLVTYYGAGALFPSVLLIFVNVILVIAFTIMLIVSKKLDKTTVVFPISYILFIIILYRIGEAIDNKMILPMIEYNYFNLFIMIDYLLLNVYSLLSIKSNNKKKTKKS